MTATQHEQTSLSADEAKATPVETRTTSLPYAARAFNAAHPDLPNAAGVPAKLANERFVESLARVVYYWGYPAVDGFGRTSAWEVMKTAGPGATLGLFPGAPKNMLGYLDDYMSPAQRKVVTPNSDTIYGAGFADLAAEPVVVQTPSDVPTGHYWTIQMADLFTTVIHQLGSASKTPGASSCSSGLAGRVRNPTASSTCCGRRPTWSASSDAALPRTAPRRRRKRAPC